MKWKIVCLFFVFLFLVGGVFSGANVFGGGVTPSFKSPAANSFQSSSPSFGDSIYTSEQKYTYWPILKDMESGDCEASTDFLISIRPGSCTPQVVRSDLLAEQSVPVFCQLDAVRVNPLIDVSSIDSISFKGNRSGMVSGLSFHPARAAVKSYRTLLGSPILNNIGYVVVVLKQEKDERVLPDFVKRNLTATIFYDAEKAYGVSRSEFYLPVMSEKEWVVDYLNYDFWQGKGFARVESISNNVAQIAIYTSDDKIFKRITLKEGQTSGMMYFPGFYCKAGLQVKLNKIVAPEKSVLLNIDGEEIWVRKGSKILNRKCSVSEIIALPDETGTVRINCPGDSFNLVIQNKGALIKDGNNKVESYNLGDNIKVTKDDNLKGFWSLGFVGEFPERLADSDGNIKTSSSSSIKIKEDGKMKSFVLLVKSSVGLTDGQIAGIYKQVEKVGSDKKNKIDSLDGFRKALGSSFGMFRWDEKDVVLLVEGGGVSPKNSVLEGVKFKGMEDANKNMELGDKGTYFINAQKTTFSLMDRFGEERNTRGDVFAELSLRDLIKLAEDNGQLESAKEYTELFIQTYPNSGWLDSAKEKLRKINGFNMEKAWRSVFVNNDYHNIRAEKFKAVDEAVKNVEIQVEGEKKKFVEKDKIGLGESIDFKDKESYILVDRISPEEVVLKFFEAKEDSGYEFGKKLEDFSVVGDSVQVNGKNVIIRDIHAEAIAHVSLIPKIDNKKSEVNFSFNIGIEKRAIQLSPEKTMEMIEGLNESIKKWDDINEKLGKLLKGWKGACFATSGVMMIKSMLSGFSGESMAREKVMKSFRSQCAGLVGKDRKYQSYTHCYNELNKGGDIDKAVEAYKKAIEEENKKISELEKSAGITEGDLMTPGSVDEKWEEAYKGSFTNKKWSLGKEGGVDIKKLDVGILRDIGTYEKLKSSLGDDSLVVKDLKEDINKRVLVVSEEIKVVQIAGDIKASLGENLKEGVNVNIVNIPVNANNKLKWDGKYLEDVFEKKNNGLPFNTMPPNTKTPMQVIQHKGEGYVVILKGGSNGIYEVAKVYKKNTATTPPVWVEVKNGEKNKISEYSFVKVEVGGCQNKFENPKVRYYDDKDKAFPAVVPFDLKNGFYAQIYKNGYKKSGEVSRFYICNVGENKIWNDVGGDDDCQSFDVNTVDSGQSICGYEKAKMTKLHRSALNAIKMAQRGKVVIGGKSIDVDAPMSAFGSSMECQDFLSVDECKILFNVCDPVICPASRCNLGGAYPVANVVQTGIIGSLVLCLPNIKEGIIVPICLTGVHAGIDNYITILKDHMKCLEHNLETGEHVGMCDVVYSIYLCEFFWRQLSPLIEVILPKIVTGMFGGTQGVRGGGEYLTVKHSMDSVQKSVDYFKNSYAQNALGAFQFSNIESVGSEFCKSFVGSSVPTSMDFLDGLLEPESPYQVYAQFDEAVFTEATVPATSHYKVYFHIYAGKNRDAQYYVYLKNPPASNYYNIPDSVSIKRGYIAKGGSADESIDITAPAGYKEVCVSVNNEESCGFKKVTTDFALNYLKDKYVEEQANKTEITSEKECISGSPSMYTMINPNLQSGVEESLSPEIALHGVVRICSTKNPGVQVDVVDGKKPKETKRWTDVGHCGDEKLRCWLDGDSVKDEIGRVRDVDGTLSGDYDRIKDMSEQALKSEKKTVDELSNLRKTIRELKDVNDIDSIKSRINDLAGTGAVGSSGSAKRSVHKADALSLLAEAYGICVGLSDGAVSGDNNNDEDDDCVKFKDIKVGNFLIDYFDEVWEVNGFFDIENGVGISLISRDNEKIEDAIAGNSFDCIEERGYTFREMMSQIDEGGGGSEGFSVDGNQIFYNGEDTGLFLEERVKKWLIREGGNNIGLIKEDGSIGIAINLVSEENKVFAGWLGYYKYTGGEFVLKKEEIPGVETHRIDIAPPIVA